MSDIQNIPGLIRTENTSLDDFHSLCEKKTKKRYLHHQIFGDYCSLQEYIECPPEEAFAYLAQTESLMEWTYSLRNMKHIDDNGLMMFGDKIGGITKCFCKTESDAKSLTVDYYCSWDQQEELWMIYYMRVVPAKNILGKEGSLVLWTNCCHPYYLDNPYPELAPEERSIWVGDGWEFFYAGHGIEMENLKRILEYRHANNIDVADLAYLK